MDNNNNIENFFRKRLESQEFSFYEEDWQKLEQRLDADGIVAPKRINGFTGKTMFFVIVLLTGSFLLGWFARGLFTKKFNEQPNVQSQNIVTTISQSDKRTTQNYQSNNDSNQVLVENQFNIRNSAQTNLNDYNKNKGVSVRDEHIVKSQSSQASNLISNKSIDESGKENNQKENNVTIPDEKEYNNLTINNFNNYVSSPTENLKTIDVQISEENNIILIQNLSPIDGRIDFPSREISKLLLSKPLNYKTNQSLVSNKMIFGERWMFGISLATDFNSIGMLHEKSLSGKIGGQLYFLISPNWWISTGIQYSNKKYNTNAEYYSPGNGYWQRRTNGVLPDNIFGTCSVFDIPIMVTYRFIKKEFISFTASAGVSNYLLQDEIYEFEFDQENPGAATGWQTAKNSMAPFNFGNIYLGVELQTSQRTFLVLEPFLQIPFKEVGWGNVKIYSTGIQAKIKYKIGNSR